MGSITTVGYGVTVRATGLITAGVAWPSIEQTFKFFDLLLLRKQNGVLRMIGEEKDKKSFISKVPVEVLEEIRMWTVARQLELEEDEMLSRYWFPFEDHENFVDDEERFISWKLFKGGPDGCKHCLHLFEVEDLREFHNRFTLGPSACHEPIRHLVAAFGLAHPFNELIPVEPGAVDLEDLAFVSIPYRSQESEQSKISIEGFEGYSEKAHSLVDLSFDLPPDADARLLRFIRTFNLEVVEFKKDTFRCTGSKRQIKDDGLKGIKPRSAKVVPIDEVKPSWKLYTSCWV